MSTCNVHFLGEIRKCQYFLNEKPILSKDIPDIQGIRLMIVSDNCDG